MIQQVEGFRDDIQMADSDGNHLQDTKIKVDVWGCGETIAPVALGAGSKGVDMFSITVEPGNWVCSEAARDTENGRKLQSGKQAHQRPWICVCGCVLGVVQVGADQPQSAQRESMPLILKR